MADIRIRVAEGDEDQTVLLWDSVWNRDQMMADWAIDTIDNRDNPGGLQAKQAIHTAVLICLFTWRRADTYDDVSPSTDPKGWWGDAVDLQGHERPLGSKLWLLLRGVLNDATARKAKVYIVEALQCLLDQKVVARIDVTTEALVTQGVLGFTVKLYSMDGLTTYDQRFDVLWRQI